MLFLNNCGASSVGGGGASETRKLGKEQVNKGQTTSFPGPLPCSLALSWVPQPRSQRRAPGNEVEDQIVTVI